MGFLFCFVLHCIVLFSHARPLCWSAGLKSKDVNNNKRFRIHGSAAVSAAAEWNLFWWAQPDTKGTVVNVNVYEQATQK